MTDTLAVHPLAAEPPDWKPRFFIIWVGQALSLLGSQLVQFGLIWYLTQSTGSATVLAIASLVGLLPSVVLSPLIGTLVDRWSRRWIMVVADTTIALATVGLAVLFALGIVQVWHIYLLMFVRAVAGGFHQSAMGASTVMLVPKEQLTRVQGMNQTLQGGLNIISAPLGALLIAWLPMQGVLAIDVSTAVLAILPLLYFAVPQPERKLAGTGPSSVMADMRAGLRYVLGWPGLMIVLLMATLINFLLTPAAALIPLLVTKHFRGDALQLGWLQAVSGLGWILGGVLLGVWGGFRRRMVTAMIGLIGIGLGTVLMGGAPREMLWLALAASLFTGIMLPITNGSMGAILQGVIAPEMQGRVFALVFTLASAMSPLGLILAGPVADRVGVQAWYWAGGVTCALMGVVGFLIPAVLNLEEQSGAHQPGELAR
jgi:DHA3 family macrolide efflux protein-like MFS transporter